VRAAADEEATPAVETAVETAVEMAAVAGSRAAVERGAAMMAVAAVGREGVPIARIRTRRTKPAPAIGAGA